MTLSLKLKNNQYIFTYMRDNDPNHDLIYQFEMMGNVNDLNKLKSGIEHMLGALKKEE